MMICGCQKPMCFQSEGFLSAYEAGLKKKQYKQPFWEMPKKSAVVDSLSSSRYKNHQKIKSSMSLKELKLRKGFSSPQTKSSAKNMGYSLLKQTCDSNQIDSLKLQIQKQRDQHAADSQLMPQIQHLEFRNNKIQNKRQIISPQKSRTSHILKTLVNFKYQSDNFQHLSYPNKGNYQERVEPLSPFSKKKPIVSFQLQATQLNPNNIHSRLPLRNKELSESHFPSTIEQESLKLTNKMSQASEKGNVNDSQQIRLIELSRHSRNLNQIKLRPIEHIKSGRTVVSVNSSFENEDENVFQSVVIYQQNKPGDGNFISGLMSKGIK